MKINLSDYTWEEAQDLSGLDPVVLLPLGAFEQHGKHLPLKVDEFMVNNIAKEAVRKSNQKKTNAGRDKNPSTYSSHSQRSQA